MTETCTPVPAADPAALDLDLIPYFEALIAARWRIAAAMVIAGLLSGFLAYSRPHIFEVMIKVSVVEIDDPGGVSPDDRRASEVLTLVEHGFVMGTIRDNH